MPEPYPLIKPFKNFTGLLQIASIEDIACMKAVAISQRGEKKDFYDMYENLIKRIGLKSTRNKKAIPLSLLLTRKS
jgi:predicted nucleotidyltransferase component of viral defense system